MDITTFGECRHDSPRSGFIDDALRMPERITYVPGQPRDEGELFELAGRRARLYFDPARVRAGIVTCGGLCPGLNDVIRSLYMELTFGYGVPEVIGFRFGYQGLDPARGEDPMRLTNEIVDDIHKKGGSILGTSRGPVDTGAAVENLIERNVNILFCVGGDGTQRGAYELYEVAKKRGHELAVVGVPKTIDNDVRYVRRTFGYLTAVDESRRVIDAAHTEARSVMHGISIVKLMGRHAGFIAAGATIASQDVNFVLIPELPFTLDGPGGFLAALKERVLHRQHAVVVVAEGAGQDLLESESGGRDASGNVKLQDIGIFLRDRIKDFFAKEEIPAIFRYFDPSYQLRGCPANTEDGIICDQFARHAVHAGMAGKTGLVIGFQNGHFIHVPTGLIARESKRLPLDGPIWKSALATTGQAATFE